MIFSARRERCSQCNDAIGSRHSWLWPKDTLGLPTTNCPACGVPVNRPEVSEWRDKSAVARRRYFFMVLYRAVVAAIAINLLLVPIIFALTTATQLTVAAINEVEVASPSGLAETWLFRIRFVSVMVVFFVVFGAHALRIGRSQARTRDFTTES